MTKGAEKYTLTPGRNVGHRTEREEAKTRPAPIWVNLLKIPKRNMGMDMAVKENPEEALVEVHTIILL